MGEWRPQVSFRVRKEFRDELAAFAAQEKRSVGNLGALLLEWSLEQLRAVGSTSRLLKSKVGNRRGQERVP